MPNSSLKTATVSLALRAGKRPKPFLFKVRYHEVEALPGAEAPRIEPKTVYLLAGETRVDVTALVSDDVMARLVDAIEQK